ncbi:hypothetical protein [Nocardia wallacei]|uniref:hypothetical protein n=1 Tax=Nocardia wallacei TaxID=480035 RepID=UPI002457F6AD|nr:hypothetical protein [Nocardia wallacei]
MGDETITAPPRGGDPDRLRAAAAVAVLGGDATVQLSAALAGLDSGRIRSVLADFAEAGWVERERFAHPAIAARVLLDLPDEQRRELHGRAAELLHRSGFPCTVVAGHLLAAGDARSTWAARVLVASADRALANDEIDSAAEQLELAYRAGRRADSRAAIAGRLVSVEWRRSPSSRTAISGDSRRRSTPAEYPTPTCPLLCCTCSGTAVTSRPTRRWLGWRAARRAR